MILIISKEKLESSTEDVIDWLKYYDEDFDRVDGEQLYRKGVTQVCIKNASPSSIEMKGELMLRKKYKSAWYRRWSDYSELGGYENFDLPNLTYDAIVSTIGIEERHLKTFFINKIRTNKWLTHPGEVVINKLLVLDAAKDCGLIIPDTFICSTKEQLTEVINSYESLIVKPISRGVSFFVDNKWITNYTELFTKDNLDDLPTTFLPTLFQENIKKKYELRCFFLKEQFYSMCIHSQMDKQTEIDFRKYNSEIPNRTVPYTLPTELASKLIVLTKQLNLSTGSIDMIRSIDGKYYFLEVNPVGQFGMTSFPCNYTLERKIAEFLKEIN